MSTIALTDPKSYTHRGLRQRQFIERMLNLGFNRDKLLLERLAMRALSHLKQSNGQNNNAHLATQAYEYIPT